MMLGVNNPKRKSKMLVYIGKIDPKITHESLCSYFENNNLQLTLINKKGERSKNYLVAETKHEATFKHLTEEKKEHQIGELKFNTDAYLTGREKFLRDAIETRKKIHVGDLPSDTLDHELKNYFSKFGNVRAAYMSKKRSKEYASGCYGFITFYNEDSVKLVFESTDLYFKGTKLVIKKFKTKWHNSPVYRRLNNEEKLAIHQRSNRVSNIKDQKLGFGEKCQQNMERFKKVSVSPLQKELLEFIRNKHRTVDCMLRLNEGKTAGNHTYNIRAFSIPT